LLLETKYKEHIPTTSPTREVAKPINGTWNVYNYFIDCQEPKLLQSLNELKQNDYADASKLVSIKGFEHPFDIDKLLMISFSTPATTNIAQFVSIRDNSLHSIEERFIRKIYLTTKDKLNESPLIIFGWSNSYIQAEELMSQKLDKPPSVIMSFKGELATDGLIKILRVLYANIYRGAEIAIQYAKELEIGESIGFSTAPLTDLQNRQAHKHSFSLRKRLHSMFTAIWKTSNPRRVIEAKHYAESLDSIRSGSFVFIFAFNSEDTLKKFEKDFNVVLTRGPVIDANGSVDISTTEDMSLSFRTYERDLLTERWIMESESEWEWKQLLEVFEIPGIKFIRDILDERRIEFEGTLYAKAVLKGSQHYRAMVKEVDSSHQPTISKIREKPSVGHFVMVLKNNWLQIRQSTKPKFLDVLASVPSLQIHVWSLRRKFYRRPGGALKTFLDLIAAPEDFDLWIEFLSALENVGSKDIRRLFISDEQYGE